MLTFQETPTPFNLVRSLLDRLTTSAPDARERLTRGISVLHVGCGRGAAVLTLANAFPRSRFTGADPSAAAIADATWLAQARRLDNTTFVLLDGQAPLDYSAFDLVMSDGPVVWQ